MQLPEKLLASLQNVKGFDREAFERIHASGEQVTSIRINNNKWSMVNSESQTIHYSPFTIHSKIPWTDFGFYLGQRPSFTFDPLFHAGTYYVQEASSMFLEQLLKQTVDLTKPLRVLDLCAAPGGKSTHLQSLISKESLLVSNEVIRSRSVVLQDNIIKWGCDNVIITNNDPKDFAKLENYFDVIVVDAPCSGSGLFRRDEEAIEEWSENNVQLCSQRQQRILADVLPALKNNGVLIYSTCSYSKEEDEVIIDWVNEELKINNLKLRIEQNWNIIETITEKGNTGYRFWPDKLKGEGFFIAAFKKEEDEEKADLRNKFKPDFITKKEEAVLEKWVNTNGLRFFKKNEMVFGLPEIFLQDYTFISQNLKVLYAGVMIGEIMRDKLVPAHALAISKILASNVPALPLSHEESIQYLQRKDLKKETEQKGWQVVTHKGFSLGWVNVLPNRINNYYPKEMRILKQF